MIALLAASQGGHEAVVSLLLEKGADVKKAECGGKTGLQAALASRCESIVKLLLEKSADVNTIAGDSGGRIGLGAA